MSVRTIVVAHREALAAEGIAAALGRYPALAIVGIATTAAEAERQCRQADAIAIDSRIPGASNVIKRLRKQCIRVVVIGAARSDADADGDGVNVPVGAPVAQLACALVPGAYPRPSGFPGLTRREGQVLRLAAKGMVCKQIARALDISPKTVEQHKTRAFRRLGVPNQAAAVAMLAEGGNG